MYIRNLSRKTLKKLVGNLVKNFTFSTDEELVPQVNNYSMGQSIFSDSV